MLYAIGVLVLLAWPSLHGSHPATPLLRRLGTRTGWSGGSSSTGLAWLAGCAPASSTPTNADGEIRDEAVALRLLQGDFAFATPLLESGARAKLAERLAASKRHTGWFHAAGGTSVAPASPRAHEQ